MDDHQTWSRRLKLTMTDHETWSTEFFVFFTRCDKDFVKAEFTYTIKPSIFIAL